MLAFIQNVGGVQLLIILVIVFIVFGAGRLPQVFEAFGKAMKSFRDAQRDDAIDVESRVAKREISADADARRGRDDEDAVSRRRRELEAELSALDDAEHLRTNSRQKV